MVWKVLSTSESKSKDEEINLDRHFNSEQEIEQTDIESVG